MFVLEQPWRVDQIAPSDGVENHRHVELGLQELRGIETHLELGYLAALDDDRRHAVHAVEPRLELVGRELPQPRLRHRVGRQAVAEDREGRERQALGGDLGGGG